MIDKVTKSKEPGQRVQKKSDNEEPVIKNTYFSQVRSEKGLALVTVLVLSLITLSIISTLVYMVIQGTRISGYYKRYETAREAAVGGAELASDLIQNRGKLVISDDLVNLPNDCDCGDPENPSDNLYSGVPSCLCDKLCDTTFNYPGPVLDWVNCGISDTIFDPTTNPDIQFDLAGINTNYRVSVKIVDTIRGNSNLSGEELGGVGVVSSTSGIIPAPPMPYLHRVEINSEDTINQIERARLSALYAF
jgi:hypothetical protein